MKTVLVIHSSLNGENSVSSSAANKFIEARRSKEEIKVVELDLSAYDLPHLTSKEMQAWSVKPEERNEQQSNLASHSDKFIQQLFDADEIVLATPMYNFGISSTLKAYFDRVARAGVTFQYTSNGPMGLIEGKKATVIFTRGGQYRDTPKDTQTPYIKIFLEFLGISDINFIFIEGLARQDLSEQDKWSDFNKKISELFDKELHYI